MALVQTVHLSMANFKSAPVVPAVQNDSGRQVKMIIDDYTLTSGLTGKIAFERSDGTHYETAAELVLADNAFVADIDQALTQPGRTMVQLKVTDTLTVSTFSFVIFVEADNSGTVTPQEGIDLVTAVEAAEAAAGRAESAAEELGNLTDLPDVIASAFSTSVAYSVGDYVMYNGHLYRFISAHAAGAWNAAHVVEVTVGDEIGEVKTQLNDNTKDISLLTYDVGDYDKTFTYTKPSGYQFFDITLSAGTYYFTVTSSGDAVRLIDDSFNVIVTIQKTYIDFPITITAEQAAQITKLSLYQGSIRIVAKTGLIQDLDSLKNEVNTLIPKVNILQGPVGVAFSSNGALISTNLMYCWYFPVTQGKKYTFDKKVSNNYLRTGYTDSIPAGGVTLYGYEGFDAVQYNHITITAAHTAYFVVLASGSADSEELREFITNSVVAYEGEYNANYSQDTVILNHNYIYAGPIYYCGPTRTLATLKAGIEAATKRMDSILYVDAGEYDLIEEFGDAYFEALTSGSTMAGLLLKNRIHIIFSPNSKVTSHYTGNNQYAKSLYSPFNAGEYGFTLENLNLECSNCRYAIHDERNGGTEYYKSHYINCKMYIDNSQNSAWTSETCIGGGLGSNAEVIVENSVFESVDASNRGGVYYHQSNAEGNTDYSSKVVIKNNYFITGCVQIDDNRDDSTGEEKTQYIVNTNSFSQKYPNTDSEGLYVANLTNTKSILLAWNNSVRSA